MTALRLQPGHVLAGKYSVRGLLGYGGATASYAATLANGRSAVVKLFSPQLADRGDILGALQRTASMTNALPADVTAPILDVGFDPQTRSPFTVTEQMPVPSLLETVRTAPLPPADVAHVLRGVAAAVDVAHSHRIAHGGLKPQNVFVAPAASGPRMVKVIDFGVSIARAVVPTDDGRWSAAPWIAPEQMQGGVDGPAVDVFSAGLLAFFAATGRPYWRSCQGAIPDLAGWQQEISGARVAASTRAQELGVALPAGWDPVLARALAHNPAERFATVTQLADALAGAAGSPVVAAVAQVATYGDAPVEAPPRSRAALWIGVAIAVTVVIGGAVALRLTMRGPPAAPVASASAATSVQPPPVASSTSSALAAVEPVVDAGAVGAIAEQSADASEEPQEELAQLTVVCVPDCDTVTIDDDVLDAGFTDPQALPAGIHTLVVAKATYLSQTRKVTLKAGQREKASFFLSKPGPAPTKQCGKFLERCP